LADLNPFLLGGFLPDPDEDPSNGGPGAEDEAVLPDVENFRK
jgi:hypothetical protein